MSNDLMTSALSREPDHSQPYDASLEKYDKIDAMVKCS